MPYITQEQRKALDKFIDPIPCLKLSEGELNYVITRILLKLLPGNYSDYSRILGVLECVKQEFYRRAVAPYEDEKCREQGDVYP